MPGLLDLLTRQLGGDTARQLGDQIGADPSSTQKAIAVALPMLLGGLAREARGNAQGLDRALERDHDGSLLENLGAVLGRSAGGGGLLDAASGLLGGLSIDRRAADGDGILGHILGGKRPAIETGISRASGLDVQKVAQLLALLAPIVMSALGKLKRDQNLDADGVSEILQDERRTLEAEAPSTSQGGLLDLLDTDDDGSVIDDVAKIGAALGGSSLLGKMFGK